MGDKSRIEWTDATWNPVVGCSKVSPGCDNCYAIPMSRRIEATGNDAYQGITNEDGWTGLVRCLPDRLTQPLRWQRPRRIFVNSMSDLFHPDVPEDFIGKVFHVMAAASSHQFQILTKRPARMRDLLNRTDWGLDDIYGWPVPNVWLGTSIEANKYTFRARHLAETPAAVRFLSLEPLLDWLPSLDLEDIHWVIVGGESGPRARPMHPEWVRWIRDQCVDAGVPFFFKQWGEYRPRPTPARLEDADTPPVPFRPDSPDPYPLGWVERIGKKQAGRELDGRTWDEYPEAVPA